MKKIIAAVTLVLLSFMSFAQNQELPTTKVRDLNGKQISFNEAFEKGKVTMVSFWATWCIPCKQEIKNVKTKLDEWQKETDFNYMTVSIDDSRATAMVKTYAAEIGTTHVRANCFSPGATRTDMRAKAMPGEDPMSLPHPDEVASQMIAMCEPTFNDNGGVWKYDSKGLFNQF